MSITKISPSVVDFDAGITISTTDNSDNLTLTSTDADANVGPAINLYRNSGTPADNDFLGNIKFNGRNDNSQDVQYAEVETYILDASDGAEDGLYNINVMTAGTNRSYMQISGNSGVVFNEDSNDIDFRVESNGLQYALFVDGGNDVVGIGTSVPSSYHSNANNLVIYEAGNAGITIATVSSNYGSIFFADGTSGSEPYTGYLQYGQDGVTSGYQDVMTIGTGATQRIGVGVYGISFGSGTHTAARGLDDYEEGTWTPGIGEGAVTIDRAHYTKIGRLVHFSVLATGFTNRTSANQVVFNNLPFPVLQDYCAGTAMANYNDETNAQGVYVTTAEQIMFYAIGSGGYLTMAHNDLNNSSASMYFFGVYTAE